MSDAALDSTFVEARLPFEPNSVATHSSGCFRASAIERLRSVQWDFSSAKTGYLTHGLHPYPAKFIPQIPNALIRELSSDGETVADIFCGSGTTLLEALQLNRHAIGIDANPLATLITQAKTARLTAGQFATLEAHRIRIAELADSLNPTNGRPFVSRGWRPDSAMSEFWFLPHVVEELAEIRRLMGHVSDRAVWRLCALALSAIIVNVSKQDSDTRYVRREKTMLPSDTVRRYLSQLGAAITAVRELATSISDDLRCRVHNQNILDVPDTESFDLVVTSPPYPNAYSYHLYHRTRLLWLDHDPEAFKKIEIGSHRKYSAKGKARATEDTFRDEFERVFQWLRTRLRDRRFACFVIGDSTLNGAVIDNATLLARAGATAGFQEVARLNRNISAAKKSFNPAIGRIKTEKILILQKM